MFRLDLQPVTLKGSDLAGGQDKQFLHGDGLVGVPDALFVHRVNGEIIIGEAKSRYHRGVITDYERYQITLYMGVAGGNAGRPVRGIFRYGCGRLKGLVRRREAEAVLYAGGRHGTRPASG